MNWMTDTPLRPDLRYMSIAFAVVSAGLSGVAVMDLHARMSRGLGFSMLISSEWWLIAVAVALAAALLAVASGSRFAAWMSLPVLIGVLHAVPALAWPLVRLNTAWFHAGLVDYLASGESPDSALDARYLWPGFFIVTGRFAALTGIAPIDIAYWWAIVYPFVFAGATALLARAARLPARGVMIAVLAVTLAFFTGQGYMSPQASALLLALGMLLWLLYQAPSDDGSWKPQRKHLPTYAVLIAAAGVLVFTHQFTSYVFAVFLILTLVMRGYRWVWPGTVVVVTIVAAYTLIRIIPDQQFFATFPGTMDNIGNPWAAFQSTVLNRTRGFDVDPWRPLAVGARLMLGAAIMTPPAILLLFARRIRREWQASGLLLAFTAAGLIVGTATPYGGEALIRVALFATLPSVIIFAKLLQHSPRPLLTLNVTAVIVAMLFIPAQWGNDSIERFTMASRDAIVWVVQNSQPRDRVVVADQALPARETDIFRLRWYSPPEEDILNPDWIYDTITEGPTGEGFVINSVGASIARGTVRPAGGPIFDTLTAVLENDPRFVLVAGDQDNQVWQVVSPER